MGIFLFQQPRLGVSDLKKILAEIQYRIIKEIAGISLFIDTEKQWLHFGLNRSRNLLLHLPRLTRSRGCMFFSATYGWQNEHFKFVDRERP
ncbi:hypothetical protein M378DRAFT_998179 [Amanita muscaria Koide BX008]|uniref:Uncharacterized protein n=1 Tax=Amanita muscaria (strain Koide BX008) TaxID=946122 RepID=A0A0C2RUK5_AMAMK|nr:hypothetical protein M378DRAFT_998179 [Amanita muscaria Koide BX008]